MKNTVKRIISVVTMISCLTCSITCSGAMKVEEELAQDRSEAIYQNAEAFLNGVVEQGSIEKTVYLYDLSEEIVAVYYTLQPYGYIIVDGEDGHVIEYSSNCEPLSDLKEHYYYMGPLEIYKKVSGGYQNVISGDVIEISDLAPVDQLYISDTDNTVNDIIDYGYQETANTTYYIVNDSYGNNGVYVCCDEVPVYSKGIMYLW